MTIDRDSKYRRSLILGVILVVGAGLVSASALVPNGIWWAILSALFVGVGVAAFTAAILGFTIDRWLKTDIARDVFLTAIGHYLPENFRELLKDEMIRLASHKTLCEKHEMKLIIEPIDASHVKVTTSISRTIKNISRSPTSVANSFALDEWGVSGKPSTIKVCKAKRSDGTEVSFDPEAIEHRPNMSIRAATKELTIPPSQTILLSSEGVEYKGINDDLSFFFAAPTINPEIEVEASEFEAEIGFGSAGEVIDSAVSKRRTLKGAYFPRQRMRVRWWPKEDNN